MTFTKIDSIYGFEIGKPQKSYFSSGQFTKMGRVVKGLSTKDLKKIVAVLLTTKPRGGGAKCLSILSAKKI